MIEDYISIYVILALICCILMPVMFNLDKYWDTFDDGVTEFIQSQGHLPIQLFVPFALLMCVLTICLLLFLIVISPFLFIYLIFRKNG